MLHERGTFCVAPERRRSLAQIINKAAKPAARQSENKGRSHINCLSFVFFLCFCFCRLISSATSA
jgi:hypothetical protein